MTNQPNVRDDRKRCTRCGEWKSLADFHPRYGARAGKLAAWCKASAKHRAEAVNPTTQTSGGVRPLRRGPGASRRSTVLLGNSTTRSWTIRVDDAPYRRTGQSPASSSFDDNVALLRRLSLAHSPRKAHVRTPELLFERTLC